MDGAENENADDPRRGLDGVRLLHSFRVPRGLKRELTQFIQQQVSPPKICLDRSLWSTLAVHVGHDPKRLAKLMPMLELMGGHVCVPNKTIILTASPETLRRRVSEKEPSERVFDELTLNYDYWEQESAFYHWLREAIAEVGLPQFQVEIVNTDNLSSAEVVRNTSVG